MSGDYFDGFWSLDFCPYAIVTDLETENKTVLAMK